MSKNQLTIQHLAMACRHVDELMAIGVTENLSIRTLELFADTYAKMHMGGSATPHHVNQVSLWSVAADQVRRDNPSSIKTAGLHFRVEHGTPRREFARRVLALSKQGQLTESAMADLIPRYWRLAVITLAEDARLNKVARFRAYDTPELRWAAAGIEFSPSATLETTNTDTPESSA